MIITTHKITILLFCALEIAVILFFMGWAARANNDSIEYEIVSPPSCKNNLGEMVEFTNVDGNRLKSAAGMAKRDQAGAPKIYRFAYQHSPNTLQQFIDFHECAHHQTGDVDLPHPPRNSPDHMMNESIADCIATLRIRDELDNGKDIVVQAVKELVRAMLEVGFPISTADSRKSNIMNCLKKDDSAQTFLDDVLKYRGLK